MRHILPMSARAPTATPPAREVRIPAGAVTLPGELVVPADCCGLVVFAHDSGSSRHSPRDRAVAQALRTVGLATLMFDLRTPEEESLDRLVGWLRSDPALPAQRLAHATRWAEEQSALRGQRIGYFGAGTGAAAAMLASTWLDGEISAMVCRAGRPDLVEDVLGEVRTPTLLLVGENDEPFIDRNRESMAQLGGEAELVVVPGAGHEFREPGALEQVASLACTWYRGFVARSLEVH